MNRRALGVICAASGVLGIALGILTLAWSPAVDEDVWSYPFPFGVGLAVGLVLTVVHVMTLSGFVGLRALVGTRAGKAGAYAAIAGFLLLAVSESAGGAIGRQQNDSSAAGAVGGMFGVASLLVAAGAIAAGIAIVRARHDVVIGRLVLATGVTLLAVVTPANISGNLAFRMTALMAWSAVFVPLGGLLARTAEPGLKGLT